MSFEEKHSMETPASYPGLGTRHFQMFLMFLNQAVILAAKSNFNIGTVAMMDNSSNKQFPALTWTSVEEGAVLSSFSWGHVVAQIPASYYAASIGPSRCLPIAMGFIGVSILAVPMAAVHGGYLAVCFTQIINGGAQAFLSPGSYTFLSKWMVPNEREKCLSFIFGGAQIGTIIMLAAGGFLAYGPGGWPSIFYITGTLCLGWSVLGVFFLADSPDCHKTISSQERNYINSNLRDISTTDKDRKLEPPWSAICLSIPFWALMTAHFADSFGSWILSNQTPRYLHFVFHFDIKKDGIFSALPVTCKWILSFVIAFLSELIIKKKLLSVGHSRKFWNSLTQLGCCLTMGLLAFLEQDDVISVSLLTMATSLNAGNYPGFKANYLDLSPNFSGILMGISSNFSDISTILAPALTGLIVVHRENVYQWRILFIVAALIYCVGAIIFLIFGSTKIQKWNSIEDPKGALPGPILQQSPHRHSCFPPIVSKIFSVNSIIALVTSGKNCLNSLANRLWKCISFSKIRC